MKIASPDVNALPTLCVRCGETTLVRPCSACGAAPLLKGRFALIEPIGRGGNGVTFRAIDLQGGGAVAVKETLLQGAAPKRKQLAEREAKVLSQLRHPAIPELRDHALLRHGRHEAFYLVQEFVEGASLEQERQSRRYTAPEVRDILRELAGVLVYLHGLSPPVFHRDLKPSNVMRRPSGALALIDFGAVRDMLRTHDLAGSTVAGTFGFMAPEQLVGDASPKSDLYSLGMLGAVLLTGKAPGELTDRSGRPTWRRHANAPESLARLIDGLLSSDPDQRPESAQVVAQRLGAEAPQADSPELPGPSHPELPDSAEPLAELPHLSLPDAPLPLAPRSAVLLGQRSASEGLDVYVRAKPLTLWRRRAIMGLSLLHLPVQLIAVVAPFAFLGAMALKSDHWFWFLVAWGAGHYLGGAILGSAQQLRLVPEYHRDRIPAPPSLFVRLSMLGLGLSGSAGTLLALGALATAAYSQLMVGALSAPTLLLGSAAALASWFCFKGVTRLDRDSRGPYRLPADAPMKLMGWTQAHVQVSGAQRSVGGGLAVGAAWGAMASSVFVFGMGGMFWLAIASAKITPTLVVFGVALLAQAAMGVGLYHVHDRLKARWLEGGLTNIAGGVLGIVGHLALALAVFQVLAALV